MKHLAAWLLFAIVGGLLALPARAQFVVVDPANLIENALTALRMLDEINNQIQQLENEAVMLENDAKNLTALDFNVMNRLLESLATTDELIARARGLAFEVQRTINQFAEEYPESYAHGIDNLKMAEDARVRWSNSLEALRTAVTMQSQAQESFAADKAVVTDLIDRSQTAVGALQAVQATNQLLAVQARQSIQAQELQIAASRATAMEQARTVAAEERSRQVRRLFSTQGTQYTPQPVGGFDVP